MHDLVVSTMIAGEEPELCRRMRALGHKNLHIDAPMTTHNLAVTRFDAYWRRAFRAGHAYAEVAARYRLSDDPLWLADSRRNLIRGTALLSAPLAIAWSLTSPWVAAGLLGGGIALVARTVTRCAWKTPVRAHHPSAARSRRPGESQPARLWRGQRSADTFLQAIYALPPGVARRPF